VNDGGRGGARSARITSEGPFIITDVVPGEVKVVIDDAPQGSRSASLEERKTKPVTLPDKYRDPEKSGLKYTITSETTELPIEIP
jgi:hypothetical protein